jgi:hypothetical protein
MSLSVDVYDEILKLDRISDMVGLRPAVVIIVVNTTRIWVAFPRAVVGGTYHAELHLCPSPRPVIGLIVSNQFPYKPCWYSKASIAQFTASSVRGLLCNAAWSLCRCEPD